VQSGFKGQILIPNIGYGRDKETKAHTAQWLLEVPSPQHQGAVSLLKYNNAYCVEIIHNVSSRNHKAILERAAQLAIRVTNPNARLHSKEN
jgi:large subunit ribosomal protein L32e